MTSIDVYIELFIVFVATFFILNFSTVLGNQLIFMFVAFALSELIPAVFIGGLKGVINHPLITKRTDHSEAAEKARIHEMKYLVVVFFTFIIISTIFGTALSQDLTSGLLYPALGSIPGKLLVSVALTLATYLEMLWLFGERLLNETTIGLVIIMAMVLIIFLVFSNQTSTLIAYLAHEYDLAKPYLPFVNQSS